MRASPREAVRGAARPSGPAARRRGAEARIRSLAKSSLGQDESPNRPEGAARVIDGIRPERVRGT